MADLTAALRRAIADVRACTDTWQSECQEARTALTAPDVQRWTGGEVQGNVRGALHAVDIALAAMGNRPVLEKTLHTIESVTVAILRSDPTIATRLQREVLDLGLLNNGSAIRRAVSMLHAAQEWLTDYQRRGIKLAPPPIVAAELRPPRARQTADADPIRCAERPMVSVSDG